MKTITVLILLLMASPALADSLCPFGADSEHLPIYYVVDVLDGDTIRVVPNGDFNSKPIKIRLYGVDAPELDQDYGYEATVIAMRRVIRTDVQIIKRGKNYDRIVGVVCPLEPSGSMSLNEYMAMSGYAWWSQKYAKNEDGLAWLHAQAKKGKRGLWKDDNPQAPWEWRKEN